jgi:transposase InsO family protein
MWACDFLQITDLFFRSLFAFFIIELHSRKVIYVGVTRSPTDTWTAQQLREATPYGQSPKYLIRDRDSKFGPSFARVAATSGIKILKTPYHAPRANAICERFMGSCIVSCVPRSSTSTKPGRIKGSSSRFPSRKLDRHYQILKAARSSPSRSWVGSIMSIEEVHTFFRIPEEVTARGMCRVPPYVQSINMQFLAIFLDEWNTQNRWMLYGT